MARPRVAENYAGSLIGALVGGLIGGPVGVGLGALTGTAANPTKPLPLEDALAHLVTSRGLTFGGMERLGWNRIRLVFGRGKKFFYVDAAIPPRKAEFANADAVDDAIYDVALLRFSERLDTLGLG